MNERRVEIVRAALMEVGIHPDRIRVQDGTIYLSTMGHQEEVFFHRAMELSRWAEGEFAECQACHFTNPSDPDDPVRQACQAEVHLEADCGLDRRALNKQAYEHWKAKQS